MDNITEIQNLVPGERLDGESRKEEGKDWLGNENVIVIVLVSDSIVSLE